MALQGICGSPCPIETYRQTLPEGTAEAGSTFHWSLIPLCGLIDKRLDGVIGSLSDDTIETLRQEVIDDYGWQYNYKTHRREPVVGGEAEFVRDHPELAQSVHECAVQRNLGNCALKK